MLENNISLYEIYAPQYSYPQPGSISETYCSAVDCHFLRVIILCFEHYRVQMKDQPLYTVYNFFLF